MAIGSGVLLPGVAENPTFPILRALAYTTGLGYRPTCDNIKNTYLGKTVHSLVRSGGTRTGGRHWFRPGVKMKLPGQLSINVSSFEHR